MIGLFGRFSGSENRHGPCALTLIMRTRFFALTAISSLALVLVLGRVAAQGTKPQISPESDTYQASLRDLATSSNRSLPKKISGGELEWTYAATLPGVLLNNYRFTSHTASQVDASRLAAARAELIASSCAAKAYKELVFNRGLTLRVALHDSSGAFIGSQDLKKSDCAG